MKKFVCIFLSLLMLFLSLFSFASCGVIEDGAEISVYLCDEIYDLDPAATYTDDNTLMLISLLYEPLFTLNKNGKLKNAAAEDYEIDRDTGDMIITLRESYWSNEERVLAKDFVYAWTRILNPNFSSAAAPLLYDIKNAVKIKTGKDNLLLEDLGIAALDEKTIRIEFESKDVDYDAFLRNLASTALSPVYQTNIEQGADIWAKSASSIYCNGPFKLRQLNYTYGYLTLSRNEGYRKKEGKEHALDAVVVPAQIRTLWNIDSEISRADHLDKLYNFMEENVIFYMSTLSTEAKKDADIKTFDRLSTYTYAFNTTNPLFSDPEVRTVLSAVISRDSIINDYVICGQVATGLVPPAVMNDKRRSSFREEGGDLISASATMTIDQANEKLDELLGYSVRGKFSIKYNEDHDEERAIASYVRDIWVQLGFTIDFKGVSNQNITVDESVYRESGIQVAYENGDFDVIGIDYQMFSANAFAGLASLSSTLNGNGYQLDTDSILGNNVGWVNDDYDEYINKALYEYNAEKKAEYLHEAEKVLMEQLPIMPLYFKQTYYLKNKKLKNLSFNYNGFPVFTMAKLKGYDNYFFDNLEPVLFPSEEE